MTALLKGCLFWLVSSIALAIGPDPSRDWRSFDTEHFVLHYEAPQRAQAEYLAAIAEQVYPRITGALQWQPRSKTEVVLLDAFDVANGFATPIPFNHTAIFLTPPDEGELLELSDWFELVFTHEFTHIVHLDKARGAPNVIRNIVGRWWFTFPNLLQPTWAIEGLATYVESDEAQLQGRLGNSYYDALMQMEVAAGVKSLREINANGRAWPLSKAYLYGAYFFRFLEQRYGQQTVYQYVNDYSDNILPFRIHSNPVRSTGKPLDELWLEYEAWLQQQFAPMHNARQQQRLDGDVLSDGGWFVDAPTQAHDGSIFYVSNNGVHRAQLHRRDRDGDVVLSSIHSGARLYAQSADSLLIAQPEICDNYDYYYDLYRWTQADGLQRLTHCARYRAVASSRDGQLFALRVSAGQFFIDQLSANGDKIKTVYTALPQQIISAFDVSADGATLLLASKCNRQWSLLKVDMRTTEPTVLLRDAAGKSSVYFGQNDHEYYFVADYDQQFNIWRLQNNELQQLSRSASAVLHLAKPATQQLVFTQLAPQGEELRGMTVNVVSTRPVSIAAESQRSSPAPVAIHDERDYSPWPSLLPRAWLPNGYNEDGALALGVSIYGQDTLGVHQYVANPMIEITQKEMIGNYAYSYNDRHHVWYSRRMDVESTREDDDGDDEVDSYTIREHAQWLSYLPKYSVDQHFIAGIGASFDEQKFVITDFDTVNIHHVDTDLAAVYLAYDSRRQFFRSVSETDGQLFSVLYESHKPFDSFYTGDVKRVEWRGTLGIGNSVLAARLLGIRADEDTESFVLGGAFSEPNFGVPLLNWRDVALRGYDDDHVQLSGHNVNFGSVEWRFLIDDVDRHLMTPPLGINRLSATLFFDRGRAFDKSLVDGVPYDRRDNGYYDSWGVELQAEIKLGYLFMLPLRIGFARGNDRELGEEQWYVQLGRAF